jgi:hypothetical protein
MKITGVKTVVVNPEIRMISLTSSISRPDEVFGRDSG